MSPRAALAGLGRLPWRQLAAWGLLLALLHWALHLKHPLLLVLRGGETPLLLLAAGIGLVLARRRLARAASRTMGLEARLRLLVWGLVGLVTLGQEGWFHWQRQQVLGAGPAMRYLGSHFVVGFRNFDQVAPLAAKGLIGGIYLSRANLAGATPAEIRARIDALQDLRRQAGLPPLFVAADQEGGEVSHLSPMLEPMPALATLVGAASDVPLETRARRYGERQGQALAGLGVNLNLAPVVDLKPAHKNRWGDRHTLIERRAIAADPATVIRVAGAYSAGLAASGVQPTLKHFPGLGRVRGDTHLVRASLDLDQAELEREWQPFREVSRNTGAAMMLAHVRLPAIDPERPASLSRPLVQDLLRRQWGYQGLLITDDLNMGAVYADGIGQAATAALDAGVDLLLISYDPDQYYRALYAAAQAWRRGAISGSREAGSGRRLVAYWQARGSDACGEGAGTMVKSAASLSDPARSPPRPCAS